jgi:hypothetical protein
MMRGSIAMTLIVVAVSAASAEPARTVRASTKSIAAATPPAPAADSQETPRACKEPACDAAERAAEEEPFKPVDLRIHLGDTAVATMEGLWLRRGPTLRNKPIMVSPIVVGGGVTLSLGGSF